MQKISTVVTEIMDREDLVREVAAKGLLNVTAYARSIKEQVKGILLKDVELGSISRAVARYVEGLGTITTPSKQGLHRIFVQSALGCITYKKTEEILKLIQDVYDKITTTDKTYITVTYGVKEITIVAEDSVIKLLKDKLHKFNSVYDISDCVGITVKFGVEYMDISDFFYILFRKFALRGINVFEIVSTATELTFLLDKRDMVVALEELQGGI